MKQEAALQLIVLIIVSTASCYCAHAPTKSLRLRKPFVAVLCKVSLFYLEINQPVININKMREREREHAQERERASKKDRMQGKVQKRGKETE